MTTKRKRRGSKDRLNLRAQLFKLSKGKCYYCRLPLILKLDSPPDSSKGVPGNYMTIDHRVPLVEGGADRLSNMVACCPRCNQVRSYDYGGFPHDLG